MAISNYVSETGETLWKVYVNVRSKTHSAIRAQRRLAGCKTQKEAEREETKLIRECERELLEKEAKGSNWKAVVDAWAESLDREGTNRLAETTRIDYVAAVRKRTSDWMQRPASSIMKLNVKESLTQLRAEGGSHGFQKRMKGLLNQVFVFGIESGLIKDMERSPTIGVQLDRPEEKKPEILTSGEIRKLLIEARKHEHPWYPIWAMALLTGMRSGELYALEWSDVDWEKKTISVNKSYNCRMKKVKSTKSGCYRTVPTSSELMRLLNEIRTETGRTPYILPRFRQWTRGLQAEELRKFCLGIGLTSIRFHALRACFATQLIQGGVPAIMIQKICGWKDLKTMQRYIRMAGVEVEGATEGLRMLPAAAQIVLEDDSVPALAAKLYGVGNGQ